MNCELSERRIRNNRLRREAELRRNIIMCLLTSVFIIGFSMLFFSLNTSAQERADRAMYKYYKSIAVQKGDTLWDYACQYGNRDLYSSSVEYIEEVMAINALTNDQITSGQYLILPYYSDELLE